MSRSDRDGLLFVLTAVTGFALVPVWVKSMQSAGMQSLDIVVWRYVLAVTLFWTLATIRRARSASSSIRVPRERLFLMGMMLGISGLFGVFGLERLPAGTFIVLFYTYPAMVAVLSAILGERLTGRGWAALAFTTIGVILTVPDFSAGLSGDNFTGVLLALGNAFLVSIYFIVSGRILRGQTDFAGASAWSVSGSLVMALVPTIATQTLHPPPDAGITLRLILLAAISTVMPIFFLNMGIQRIGPARAAISGTIEPILTLTFASLFLGESMLPVQLVGGALILASVVLLQLPSRRKNTA